MMVGGQSHYEVIVVGAGVAGIYQIKRLADLGVNALVLDLDLPISLDDLERRPWNREATHQLFDGLEFRVLRDRLQRRG